MGVPDRVEAPSGRQIEVMNVADFRPKMWHHHNVVTLGRTWILAIKQPDSVLRSLDRPALRLLDRNGAQNCQALAAALRDTRRFQLKRLETDVSDPIAGAWLDFAYRRRLVEPFPGDPPGLTARHWNATAYGRARVTQQWTMAAVRTLPKIVTLTGSLLAIVATLIGGAAVVPQVLEKNSGVVATATTGLAVVVGYAAFLAVAQLLLVRWAVRIQVARLDILSHNGRIDLPQPVPQTTDSEPSQLPVGEEKKREADG